jgi:hypothetical protein
MNLYIVKVSSPVCEEVIYCVSESISGAEYLIKKTYENIDHEVSIQSISLVTSALLIQES